MLILMLIGRDLLWLQTAYAIWQFFRYTKFLRLPYVILSSSWNSGFSKSWFQKRKFLWIEGEAEFNTARVLFRPNEQLLQSMYGYCRDTEDHSFFKIGNEGFSFYIERPKETEMCRLLTHEADYFIAYKLLPVYREVYVLKCISLHKALAKVVAGAKVCVKEEYCLLDETTDEYLNENFMRILSILPLSLQAKGFDSLSTLLSALLLLLDVMSVPANALWQRFCRVLIQYTKLTLAYLPTRLRIPIHYVLSTGSEGFMFTDNYRRKTYWAQPGDFLVMPGSRMDGWQLKNTLRGQKELTVDNKAGSFNIAGQEVLYTIIELEDPAHMYAVILRLLATGFEETLTKLDLNTLQYILYQIDILHNLRNPPVAKVQGRSVHFTRIEILLRELSRNNHNLYTSPQHRIYCS